MLHEPLVRLPRRAVGGLGMSGSVNTRRARRRKGHESISRDMLQTKTLTLKARGLLSLLESLPPDWKCHGVAGLVEQYCDLDGPHAVTKAIEELEAHGLFARMKRQGEKGKWEWLWTWSDDPDDITAERAEWEAKGYRLGRRGGNRQATPPRKPAAPQPGPAVSGKLEHGEDSGSMFEFPVDGFSVDGPSVDGEPRNIEIYNQVPTGLGQEIKRESPPTPADAGAPRCEHGKTSCRACGTSPRERAAADKGAELRRAQACTWCRQDGASRADPPPWLVIDPERPFELLPRRCDHVTDPAQVLAELRERGVA